MRSIIAALSKNAVIRKTIVHRGIDAGSAFIGINRVPSSADCCESAPLPDWVFGTTEIEAELNLDAVANTLEDAIADGTFTSLCESKGFPTFDVLTTYFTESVTDDRYFVDSVMHILIPLSAANWTIFIEPHRDYRLFFREAITELLSFDSHTRVQIDSIQTDNSTNVDTGDARFDKYRRLTEEVFSLKVYFIIDLGSLGSFFEQNFAVGPKSARTSVSYLQYLQSATRVTGKACGVGYMGHDCTERICPYGVSIYSSLFVELDINHVPGFQEVNGDVMASAEHAYAECSNAGLCNRATGQCDCFHPYTGKGCVREKCPEDCNGHGKCTPSSFVDGSRPPDSDPVAFSTQDWNQFKQHECKCDAGWEGLACADKMCPRGDYVMTLLPNHDEELSGCDVQEITFHNFSVGDYFVLRFVNFERDEKVTSPILFTGNATSQAKFIATALEEMPNEVVPTVTTISGNGTNVTVEVVFTDGHTSGMQELLQCGTISPSSYCGPGSQPLMEPSHGVCTVRHLLQEEELNENLECGGRGRCDREEGICDCNIGTYGEACEMITDYL